MIYDIAAFDLEFLYVLSLRRYNSAPADALTVKKERYLRSKSIE